MNDLADLYTATLKCLGDSLVAMTSAEWDAMILNATSETRRDSALLMLRVQEARLGLSNSLLTEISTEMKANEVPLRQGIKRVQSALDRFDSVERVLKGITGVLSIVGRIVTLL